MKTQDLLHVVRSRLNRAALIHALAWALAIGGGALVLLGIACTVQGYPVMGWCYATGALLGIVAFTAIYLRQRRSHDEAARFADDYFNTKDTLTSDLHFQRDGRSGPFIDLVSQQAATLADRLHEQPIVLPQPKRLLAIGSVLALAALSLSFRSPSPEVIQRWQQQIETEKKTAEVNEEIRQQLEAMKKDLAEGDEPLAKDLEKIARELRETQDLKEAMRQYAALERRIAEAMQKVSRREEEALLRQAGEALQQDPANRQLGQQLANKEFADAAKQLATMAPKSDGANPEAARQQLEKLRSAAQRMGEVAKDAMQRQGQQSPSGLAQTMSALDAATRQLDDSLKQAQQLQKQGANEQQKQQNQQQQKQAQSQCQQCMSQMQKKLGECSQCRSMGQKLNKLSQCMSQCQSYMNGQCKSCQGTKPGGKKAGNGSVESRRDGSDPLPFTSETMQVQGQKGQGPSDKTIEAADSGDRTGSRSAGARERAYLKQAESFVHREDIPAEVREGVKTYFKTIQDKPAEPAPDKAAPPAKEAPPPVNPAAPVKAAA